MLCIPTILCIDISVYPTQICRIHLFQKEIQQIKSPNLVAHCWSTLYLFRDFACLRGSVLHSFLTAAVNRSHKAWQVAIGYSSMSLLFWVVCSFPIHNGHLHVFYSGGGLLSSQEHRYICRCALRQSQIIFLSSHF